MSPPAQDLDWRFYVEASERLGVTRPDHANEGAGPPTTRELLSQERLRIPSSTGCGP